MSEIIKIGNSTVYFGMSKDELANVLTIEKSADKIDGELTDTFAAEKYVAKDTVMFNYNGDAEFIFVDSELAKISFSMKDIDISVTHMLKNVLESEKAVEIAYMVDGREVHNTVVTEEMVFFLLFDRYRDGTMRFIVSPRPSSFNIMPGEGTYLVWQGGSNLVLKYNGITYKIYSTKGPDIHIVSESNEYIIEESFDIPLLKSRFDGWERINRYLDMFCKVIDNKISRVKLWNLFV